MRITLEQFTYGMSLLAIVHGDDHPVYKNPDIAEIWFDFFTAKFSNDKFLRMVKHYLAMCHWFPRVPNDICKVWEESGDERRPGENWLENKQVSLMSLPSQEAALQARELQETENMSLEKMAENRKRLALMQLIAKNMRSLHVEDKEEKMKKQGGREQGAGEKIHPQGDGVSTKGEKEQGSFHPQGVRFVPPVPLLRAPCPLPLIKYLTVAPLHEVEAIARTCEKAKKLSVKGDTYGNLKASPDALFEDMHKYFHSGSEKYRQVAIDWASNASNNCELVKDGGRVIDIKQIDS